MYILWNVSLLLKSIWMFFQLWDNLIAWNKVRMIAFVMNKHEHLKILPPFIPKVFLIPIYKLENLSNVTFNYALKSSLKNRFVTVVISANYPTDTIGLRTAYLIILFVSFTPSWQYLWTSPLRTALCKAFHNRSRRNAHIPTSPSSLLCTSWNRKRKLFRSISSR